MQLQEGDLRMNILVEGRVLVLVLELLADLDRELVGLSSAEVVERLQVERLLAAKVGLPREIDLARHERTNERGPVPLVQGRVQLEREAGLGEVAAPDVRRDELMDVVDVWRWDERDQSGAR